MLDNPLSCALAVVPAAGIGRRMHTLSLGQQHLAKQYLPLAGSTVIEHTLQILTENPRVERIVVGINPLDTLWCKLPLSAHPKIDAVPGGGERADTVLNCLRAFPVSEHMRWVIVHDAVRPCLRHSDIESLWSALEEDSVGGLLAMPIVDTIKRSDIDGKITVTVARDNLWAAQTPQMFRLGQLLSALQRGCQHGRKVADEASAMEAMGVRPRLVIGSAQNIKITHAEDLSLAASYLRDRSGSSPQ